MRVAAVLAALMIFCLAGMMDNQTFAAQSRDLPGNGIAPPQEIYSTQRIIVNWDGFPNSDQLREMFNDGSGGQIPIATDFTWEAIGPEGGVIPSLASDPQDPTHIYATTYGFPGSIYVSTNSGQSWQMLGIIRDDIYHITIDPTNHNVMYVTSNDGLYKSTDGGISWNYSLFGANLGVYTAEIKVNPQNPNILYAAGSVSRTGDSYDALAALKSTDAGATWQPYMLTGFHQLIYPGFIDFEPTDPNVIFLGGQTTDGVLESYLLFKSTDAGNSWFDSDSSKTIYRTPFAIAFDPSNASRIYVGTYSAVFTSTDGGRSWTPNTSAQAYDLLVDPTAPNTIYATYNRAFKSMDYGVTWNQYANYLRGYSRDLQMINSNEILWSGWCGVFKTQDAGLTWQTSSSGLVASEIYSVAASRSEPNVIYACSFYTGIYKSTDYGATWSSGPFGSTYPMKIFVDANDSRHLLLSDGYLSESTDGGQTWQDIAMPEDSLYIDAISVNPATMDTIWFLGFDRSSNTVGMYKSVDGGQNWSVFHPGGQADEFVDAIEVDPTNNNIVFAGVYSGSSGVHVTYRTTDGGATWDNVWSDTNNWITSYAIDPSAHNRIYAASWDGLFKSTDMGTTWRGPVGSPHIYDVIINPNNTSEIFAGTYSNGIDHSINHGASWEHIGNNLTIPSIRCLEIGQGSNQYLYAGTEGGGIYRTALTTGIADNGSLPNDFVLYGNYPNPFNAQTTIKYDIPRESNVSIDIFDLLGRKVGTIAEGVQKAGSHEATWDAGANSSGVYLYKISAGSHSETRKMLLLK